MKKTTACHYGILANGVLASRSNPIVWLVLNGSRLLCGWIARLSESVIINIPLYCSILILPFLSIGLISCSGSGHYGDISVNAHYIPPRVHASFNILTLPSGSDKVSISITGTDFNPIVKNITIAANPSGVTISSIPAGENRTVSIDIKDAAGAIIAKGKTAGVKIKAGSVNSVDILVTQTGLFTQLESKVIPRAFAVSSPLPDGTYMIIGGVINQQSSCGQGCIQLKATSQTEIYNPETGIFRQGPSMIEQRAFFTANVLSDGSIAVAGGTDMVKVSCAMTACSLVVPQDHTKASVEVYDPRSNSFYKAQALTMPRAGHTANTLSNDTILFAGGISTYGASDSAELIDVRTGRDTPYAMSYARAFQTAVTYHDDGIFLAGGSVSSNQTEFFQQSGFTLSNNITCAVYSSSSAFLSTSGVIVLNGGLGTDWQPVSQLMVVDPANRVVLSYHNMPFPRALFSDIVLGNSTILIAGGVTTPVFTATTLAEIFSPVSKSFSGHPVLSEPRAGYAAQGLHDGSALIVSGFSSINPLIGDVTFADTAEIYNP